MTRLSVRARFVLLIAGMLLVVWVVLGLILGAFPVGAQSSPLEVTYVGVDEHGNEVERSHRGRSHDRNKRWDRGQEVDVQIYTDAQHVPAVREAAFTWHLAMDRLGLDPNDLPEKPDCTGMSREDNRIVVCSAPGSFGQECGCGGEARIFSRLSEPEVIFAAKVWLYTEGSTSSLQRRHVALHELGHALGLAHEHEHDSVMNYANAGDTWLHPHDLDALHRMGYRSNAMHAEDAEQAKEKKSKKHKGKKHGKRGRK